MTEISREILFHDMTGLACGPVNIVFVDAEIKLKDDGETVYVFGDWDSESCEIRYMTTRKSLLDISRRLSNADDIDLLTAERKRIVEDRITEDEKFKSCYKEIKRMIIEEMESHGYKPDFID